MTPLVTSRFRIVTGWMPWAFCLLLLMGGCQASVSAEGGTSEVVRERDIVTPKTTTVTKEEWVTQ